MANFQDNCEIDCMDKLLIDCVREYPTLYYTDNYTESDERNWDILQKKTGIQKSWLKKRWKAIRNDHRKIIIYNHTHSKKIPMHKLSHHLRFLIIDLNGANKMDFGDLERPISESFHVTEQMLNSCDISEGVTSVWKVMPKDESIESHVLVQSNQMSVNPKLADDERILDTKPNVVVSNESETNTANIDTSKRCEDTIFGELVVAMLQKMGPEEKKRAKKEIMNILL